MNLPKYNDYSLQTAQIITSKIDYYNTPARKIEIGKFINSDGGKNIGEYIETKNIEIEGWIITPTQSGLIGVLNEFRRKLMVPNMQLEIETDKKYTACVNDSIQIPKLNYNQSVVSWKTKFLCVDPYAYSANKYFLEGIVPSGENILTLNLTLSGEVYPQPELLIKFNDVSYAGFKVALNTISFDFINNCTLTISGNYYYNEYIIINFADFSTKTYINIDGKYQTAVVYGGYIYTSSNYGVTWTQRADSRDWFDVSISSDGQYQTAVVANGYIYTSSDYGVTWAQRASSQLWRIVSISADGKHQTAVVYGGYIYTSSDYGATWTQRADSRNWRGISISADGKYQTAVVYGGYIYTSSNYGVTWTQRGISQNWINISISADGKYQTAVIYYDYIYTSSDYGVTWTQRADMLGWQRISLSSDGKYQTAVANGGFPGDYIFTSNDYGITWTQRSDFMINLWTGISLSADGKYQTVVANYDSDPELEPGYIYTSSDYGDTWTPRENSIGRQWNSVSINKSFGNEMSTKNYNGFFKNLSLNLSQIKVTISGGGYSSFDWQFRYNARYY